MDAAVNVELVKVEICIKALLAEIVPKIRAKIDQPGPFTVRLNMDDLLLNGITRNIVEVALKVYFGRDLYITCDPELVDDTDGGPLCYVAVATADTLA